MPRLRCASVVDGDPGWVIDDVRDGDIAVVIWLAVRDGAAAEADRGLEKRQVLGWDDLGSVLHDLIVRRAEAPKERGYTWVHT